MLSHVPQPKCLLTFRSSPFNHQSSKSRFNYEPCLFSPPQNSIRTNKRAFSAIMGLSIGWQPRTETLCMFVSGYLCVCDNHVWVQSSPEVINGKSVCVCVCAWARERECVCQHCLESCLCGCCQWRAEGKTHYITSQLESHQDCDMFYWWVLSLFWLISTKTFITWLLPSPQLSKWL